MRQMSADHAAGAGDGPWNAQQLGAMAATGGGSTIVGIRVELPCGGHLVHEVVHQALHGLLHRLDPL